MDTTRTPEPQTCRETRFRLPSTRERAMGLWVDRIGAGESRGPVRAAPLRLLGQFAAVGVLAGKGQFQSHACGLRRVVSGEVMLLFPETAARYGADPCWSTCWIVWNGPEAECLAREAGFTPANPVLKQGATAVSRACSTLVELISGEDFAAVLERKRILLGLVAELLRLRSVQPGSALPGVLTEALRLIAAGENRVVTVREMAASAHISQSQLRRQFLRHTGRSPLAFVTAQRMARAQALLSQGESIKATAALTGYADVFHFMRVFRKTVGQTAGRFARTARVAR
ncbi:MAG: helix-turn-helix transcriptional regulator [Kiritimatiellae bacterium]|nr:helix-turn-helix transcriptional regulator [Kiritimatiellia bacterium]